MNRRDEDSIIEIKERTREIMRKKGIQGKEIARKLNISAATVSKDINTNNPENIRTFFTADQLPALCDLLGCTVDFLLTGKEGASTKKEMNVKDVCELLLEWIESGRATITLTTKEEKVWILDHDESGEIIGYSPESKEIKYPCFYFSEYEQIPENLEYEEQQDYEMIFNQHSNSVSAHKQINDFLRGVGNLRILLLKNQLDQELYNAAVAGLLLKIKD